MGQTRTLFPLFCFRPFLIRITMSTIQIEKSIDGVLGIRTRGSRMKGADKTTELWRLNLILKYFVQDDVLRGVLERVFRTLRISSARIRIYRIDRDGTRRAQDRQDGGNHQDLLLSGNFKPFYLLVNLRHCTHW